MIRHIVLYRFKETIPTEEIHAVLNKLAKLKDLVAGVEALEWGAYQGKTPNTAGYNYGLSVDLLDNSVFAEYSPHPLHQEVRKEMAPLLEKEDPVLMFDFELSTKKQQGSRS